MGIYRECVYICSKAEHINRTTKDVGTLLITGYISIKKIA